MNAYLTQPCEGFELNQLVSLWPHPYRWMLLALGMAGLACTACQPEATDPPQTTASVDVELSGYSEPNFELPALALTPDNLALVAARLDPAFSLRQYAMNAASNQRGVSGEQYYQRLTEQLEQLDPATPFRIERAVRLGPPETDTHSIALGLIRRNVISLVNPTSSTAPGDDRQFSGKLDVLVPNSGFSKRWPLGPQRAAEWTEMLERKRLRNVAGHAEALLMPVSYLGHGQFQFVVVRVEVTGDDQTLYSAQESRSPATLVSNSLLREGITWHASPNHHYNLFGLRLLEVLPEGEDWLGECRRAGHQGIHHLVNCVGQIDWRGISLSYKRYYRGGRLEQVELTNPEAISGKAIQGLKQAIIHAIGMPRGQELPNKFNQHRTQFEWFPERLAAGSEQPFLRYTTSEPAE